MRVAFAWMMIWAIHCTIVGSRDMYTNWQYYECEFGGDVNDNLRWVRLEYSYVW